MSLCFEDFEEGAQFLSGGITLTEGTIVDFALLYDPQPFHLDAAAARDTPFEGLVASGFQTLFLTFRLFYQLGHLATTSVGGGGIDEVRWLAPVRPGDTIRARVTVAETRPFRSRTDAGLVRLRYETLNQHDAVVMTATLNHFVARRGSGG